MRGTSNFDLFIGTHQRIFTCFSHPIWKRKVWKISMMIMADGDYTGAIIPFYLNAIPKGKRPTPSSEDDGRHLPNYLKILAPPGGLEPPACGLGNCGSLFC